MSEDTVAIKLYALSTCSHCTRTKRFFEECNLKVVIIDVDLLNGEERTKAINEVRRLNPDVSFPTIVIGDKVIVGFNELRIKEALGLK